MHAVVHEGLRPTIPTDCPRELLQLIEEVRPIVNPDGSLFTVI